MTRKTQGVIVVPVISYRYGHLNKTYTMTTPVQIPMWMEAVKQGPTPG